MRRMRFALIPGRWVGISIGINQYHELLDAILGEIEWFADRRLFPQARTHFEAWCDALKRHTAIEEHLVFPKYRVLGGDLRIVSQRESEHELLKEGVAHVSEVLAAEDSSRVDATIVNLEKAFRRHNYEEERHRYSAIDAVLKSDAERAALVQVLQRATRKRSTVE